MYDINKLIYKLFIPTVHQCKNKIKIADPGFNISKMH